MDAEPSREQFATWRDLHARPAWTPVIGVGNGATLFGGVPTHSSSGDWPTCGQCGEPMQFLLQLDLTALPAEFEAPLERGRFQLFYCATDDGSCETWEPFSGTAEFRLVTDPVQIRQPAGVESYVERQVELWERVIDFPHFVEHASLGLDRQYDFENRSFVVTCADPDFSVRLEVDEEPVVCSALGGEKLGGWPLWVQNVEYPACPDCGTPMELVLQLDSNRLLDKMWGDGGVAHVTQCHNHPETFAFAWACG